VPGERPRLYIFLMARLRDSSRTLILVGAMVAVSQRTPTMLDLVFIAAGAGGFIAFAAMLAGLKRL
jgi:hypothetical protein